MSFFYCKLKLILVYLTNVHYIILGKVNMATQYYLDLEKYSLHKFKENLQKREMIPSRVVLKEDIEENFRIFDLHGIKSLKALLDLLKTKPKIEEFAKKSGLSVHYLTVLKREAGSYLPSSVNLIKFPGIDSKTVESLEKIGIKTTKQFFSKINTGEDINTISEKTSISIDKLNELVSLSDLARLYGVGPVFARIIYKSGIDSVESFTKYTAEEFIKIYEKETQKKADFSIADISFSIDLAKELISN